jgi:hypothetical protein
MDAEVRDTIELLPEHQAVRLTREIDGFPAGTRGAIVDLHGVLGYTVELFDEQLETIGLVSARPDDVEPRDR